MMLLLLLTTVLLENEVCDTDMGVSVVVIFSEDNPTP